MTCFGGSFQIRYVIMRQKYCGLNQYTLTVQVHFLPHLPESCFVCWALKRVTNAAAKLGVIANELCKCYAAPDVCFFLLLLNCSVHCCALFVRVGLAQVFLWANSSALLALEAVGKVGWVGTTSLPRHLLGLSLLKGLCIVCLT